MWLPCAGGRGQELRLSCICPPSLWLFIIQLLCYKGLFEKQCPYKHQYGYQIFSTHCHHWFGCCFKGEHIWLNRLCQRFCSQIYVSEESVFTPPKFQFRRLSRCFYSLPISGNLPQNKQFPYHLLCVNIIPAPHLVAVINLFFFHQSMLLTLNFNESVEWIHLPCH